MNRTDRRDTTQTDRTLSDRSMGNVSHTHPFADRGTVNRPFQRGPVVAADGGERTATARTSEDDPTDDADTDRKSTQMKDVDHTPPHDEGDSVNRVFERGERKRPVESEK